MTHWRKYASQESPYLHHWDIAEHSPVAVEIVGHEMGTVYSQEDNAEKPKLFIRLKGAKKPLGLNVTNCTILEQITGQSDPDAWIGHKITLRTAKCRQKDCIRIDYSGKLPGNCPRFKYTDGPKGDA